VENISESESKNTDKVSIIIPTHNRVELLKRALESCFSQTYKNIEIIIINDCSTDGTKEYLDSLDSIKVIHNPKSLRAPKSRNLGAEHSTGEYLCFLDDDDVLLPRKIEKQVRKFQELDNPNVGILSCDSLEIRKDKSFVVENRKKGNLHKDLLAKYCVVGGTLTLLIKREAFYKAGMFDVQLRSNQEYDLMIRIARDYEFDFVPEVLVHKYETDGQISTDFKKKSAGTRYLIIKSQSEYRKYGLSFYIKHMVRLSGLVVVYELSALFGIRFYRMIFP